MKTKKTLLIVGFLAVTMLIYAKFESTIKAKTEEQKTEMVAKSKTTKELSPGPPNPNEEPGWQQYTKNDPAGIFIDGEKKLELRYKFGSSEESKVEEPFVDGVLQGDYPNLSSLVPNVYLHDYSTYESFVIGGGTPEILEVGDVNALDRGDDIQGPNTSAPILLSWVTDTGEHKTIYKNDPSLRISNIKLYRKIEEDQTITSMLKYNWRMEDGFFKGYQFEATNVLKPYKGTIRVETYMKNSTPDAANKPVLKNITLDSHYPIGLGYTETAGLENPIFYIGSNRGLYMQYENHLRNVYRLNYFFNVPNPVNNWLGATSLVSTWDASSSKEQRAEAERNNFLNEQYIFNGITGVGNEQDNGKAGTNVPEPPAWISSGIKSPAFSMKSPVNESFEAGDTISYAFNVGLQKIDDTPSIVLDETEDFRLKGQNTYSLKGQWFDNDSTEIDLFYSVDGGAVKGPYRQRTTADMLGQGIEFSIDLTEPGDLKPQDHEIEVYAKDIAEEGTGLEPAESNHEFLKLVYVDDDPKIELEETMGSNLPGGYKVKGRYTGKDEKYKPATISYKKATDPDSNYKEMTVINSPNQTFEFTIPEKDMPDLNGTYVFSIRGENKYGVLSNVEDVLLSNEQTKPKFTLSKDSKENLLDQTAADYEIDFTSFAHTGLFYPLTIQYKVDDETEWQLMTDQSVGTMTAVLTEVTEGPKKIKLPASKLPFGENHVVHFVVADRFGIISDEQSVVFMMPGKPELILENKNGPSLGETQVVKGTIKTDYFPAKFQYKIVKNGETGAVYREVAEKDVIIDQTTGKFTFSIADTLLPAGASYDIFVKGLDKYNQESEEVSYHLTEVVHFKAKFTNSVGETIHPDITIDRELGTKIDLALEKEVQDTLTKLKQQYTLVDSSIPKNPVDVDSSTAFWEYKFTGRLTYVSSPEAFDFRLQIASYKKIRIDDPKVVGLPLVVSDTRESKPGWSLSVKLTEELLNEDGKTTLKNAIRYKHGEAESILNSQLLPVFRNLDSGKYDISKDWSPTGDGLKLEIAPGAVNALGKYHGEILFELSETP
ncbi:hypothetical protein BCR24_07540 [Enterococcus ureilyticus]|uniref:MucBP domain-containing protein n=1 Tax=Enterococcus ureilyticus TaxID=1131292 RepID=A0A1E5H8Q0_9ENTE|nr:hypothetical protein [Enterococcus ureilyticus]MBM7687476.1 hypothetical protein [Enterococcus ureilyticus]OEG21311.1 hypothetical protein BCR24_07540 [Enterococcus ureilyticus]